MRKIPKNNQKLLKEVVTKSRKIKSLTNKLEIDELTNHYLEVAENKDDFIKKMIKDINRSATKKKIRKNREYFDSINSYFKGKLFYIAFKSGKFLKIKGIEDQIKKNTLLQMIKEIESGQEYAWDLIDSVQNKEIRDFLYGIFSYIYY